MCRPNNTRAEIALFIFGLISFIVSVPGIFYSAVFCFLHTLFIFWGADEPRQDVEQGPEA